MKAPRQSDSYDYYGLSNLIEKRTQQAKRQDLSFIMALDKPQALEFRCEKPQIIGDGHCSDSTNGGGKAEAIRQDKQARGVLRGQALGIRDSESAC